MKTKANSDARIVVEAIKRWMKKHGGENVPSFSELTKAMDISVGNPTNYTNMKKAAFRELEQEGFVLKYNDRRTVAMVDDYKPPADVAEKTAAKICGLEGEQEPAKEQTPTEVAERIVQNFKEKLDKIAPEDLEEPEQKKQKPPFFLYINKPCIPATGCEGLGIILSAISQMPDAEKTNLSIQIQVKELGAEKK